jgi:hypothetical protein
MKIAIYLNLLNETVAVRRPVEAEHLDGDVYLILNQSYDGDVERWEFEPGDRVVCEPVETSEGRVLARGPIGQVGPNLKLFRASDAGRR